MKRREEDIDQAHRKLMAALRDLDSVKEHLERARTGAVTRATIDEVSPKLRACVERIGDLLKSERTKASP